jgi:hypothetical protein
MEPASNPLDLLRQRRAMNRVEAAMRKTEEVPKPGGYRYLGRNADTGQGIIVGNDGSVIPGDIITSGHIKPGQAVRVAQAGGMVQLDQKPRVRKVVPVVAKEEKFGNVKILFSVVEGAERIYYVGGDRAKPKELARFSSAPYGDPALKATGKGLNRFYWTGRVQVVGDNGHIVDSRYNAPTAFPLFDNALLFASAFRGTGYEAISLNRADPNNVIARRVTYIDGVATEDSERIGIDTGPVTDFSYENNARVGGNLYKVPYTAYRYSSSGADDYIQQLNATTAVIWGEEVSLLIHSISNRTATINTSSEDFKAMFLAGNTVTLGETARSLLRGLQFALYLPNFLPIYRRSAFLCNWLPRVSPSEGVYESIAKFISFVATGGAAQLSAPFSVIDLETSAISEKTIKIYPLPSNPTIQIHSVSYHP